MTTRADIVAEAWTWVGTPFHWQASLKGVGCDCKGLVWGVARVLGMPEAASPFAAVCDYDGRVPLAVLRQGLAATFDPGAGEPGDVLLLTVRGQAQHLGIHAGDRLIHTYNGGKNRVIDSPLSAALRAWPLVSAWRFRSLVD